MGGRKEEEEATGEVGVAASNSRKKEEGEGNGEGFGELWGRAVWGRAKSSKEKKRQIGCRAGENGKPSGTRRKTEK